MWVSISTDTTGCQGVTFILGLCVLGETSLVNNYQANPPCLLEYNTLK